MSKKYTNPKVKSYHRSVKLATYEIPKEGQKYPTYLRQRADLDVPENSVLVGAQRYDETLMEFTVEEYPGKVFGIWSKEACWVRDEGQPAEDIQYGYSNAGPYYDEDPDIFWDVLTPIGENGKETYPYEDITHEDQTIESIAEEIGLDLDYWEKN